MAAASRSSIREKISESGLVAPDFSNESLKYRVNTMKFNLEGWREVLIHMHNVLLWKKPIYPLILWAVVTTFFGIVYFNKLSALTTLSILGIFIVLSDYLVPIAQNHFLDRNLWTTAKEHKYEEVCQGIITLQDQFLDSFASLSMMKNTKPTVYFLTVIITLLLLAWAGSMMDNLLLTYVFVCTALMLPGLISRGYLRRYCILQRSPPPKKNN